MRRAALAASASAGLLLVAGCTATPAPEAPAPTSTPTSAPTSDPTSSTEPTPRVSEPTTTNTLPPPPAPTSAAPSTSGPLTAATLPVPTGWKKAVAEGGAEEGFEGNGTWVHAKDPRYAAQDLITIGCAPVTRDDYPDPIAALEGSYIRDRAPGVGLVLQFRSSADAVTFFERYVAQVRACDDPDVVRATVTSAGSNGLIDRRAYPDDSRWTEVAGVRGDRATFVILNDRGRTSTAAAQTLLASIS